MQNWIIRYVETLKARIDRTDCSIAAALDDELPRMTEAGIQKLREAAADLERILCLELGRRQDLEELRAEVRARSQFAPLTPDQRDGGARYEDQQNAGLDY